MTKDDYVIVCGDFGIWDDVPEEWHRLDWLNEKPFTTLFVDGNHENFDRLYAMPVSEWHGGQVHFVRDSIIHLMRGQVFDLAGKRVFTMGGASSHDIDAGILEPDDPDFKSKQKALDKQQALYRIKHVSWWEEELPIDEEYQTALYNLDTCNWKVDWIISHCCPSSIMDIIGGGMYQHDRLTDFFEEIKDRCRFSCWFLGHYHDNRTVRRKYMLLYDQIMKILPPG
jgi:Putative NADH-flavin reductase